ncbi:MAG: DUF3667 domain-containing protein [Reichenbachiella sp.]|uniref:DUF3667 domain-containing protein n=1 Tax=Reichenbachiella sp. TaxID=2184521 RepID=UPI003267C6C0
MRTLRKTKKCLNCGTPLAEVYDYCPMCGQQNDDKNVSFKEISRDLVENFFSFDSRLAQTIFPFFFKPGHLTNEYNAGRRFTYANPIRLYIIVSVFYFFVLNSMVGDATRDFKSAMSTPEADEVQSAILTELDSAELEVNIGPQFIAGNDSSNLWPMSNAQWHTFFELKDKEGLNEQQFFDSLKLDDRHAFTQYTVKQIIRVYKKDKEHLTSKIVHNMSLMMFVMIPVFALLLKLLYVRRKILYINHLIHTIHIHTFAFLVYGLSMALLYWLVDNEEIASWVSIISVVLVSTHAYLSFKKVYKQSWLKTLIKFWLTGFIYSYVLIAALLIEMFVSFLII